MDLWLFLRQNRIPPCRIGPSFLPQPMAMRQSRGKNCGCKQGRQLPGFHHPHLTLSKPTLFSCLVYKYLPLPLLNVFFLSSYHKHLKQTTHYYKQVIPTTAQHYNHNNSTSLITTTAIMSGIINKIKDAVTGDHSSSTTSTSHSTTTHGTSGVPEGTAGPHSSRAANAADPRVGKSYSPQPHLESSILTHHQTPTWTETDTPALMARVEPTPSVTILATQTPLPTPPAMAQCLLAHQ